MDNYIGEIRLFAGDFAPDGWAFCDGSLLTISDNTALFVLIGSNYGGDGKTTFGLPDLRGRVPLHPGPLGNTGIEYTLAETGGVETVTLTTAQIAAHNHSFTVSTVDGASAEPKSNILATPSAGCEIFRAATSFVTLNSQEVGSVGGGQSHSNMQTFVALNFIIALQGSNPPRS